MLVRKKHTIWLLILCFTELAESLLRHIAWPVFIYNAKEEETKLYKTHFVFPQKEVRQPCPKFDFIFVLFYDVCSSIENKFTLAEFSLSHFLSSASFFYQILREKPSTWQVSVFLVFEYSQVSIVSARGCIMICSIYGWVKFLPNLCFYNSPVSLRLADIRD